MTSAEIKPETVRDYRGRISAEDAVANIRKNMRLYSNGWKARCAMTSATEHVCARCGKQLGLVNWWTAGVFDRYGGDKHKLCGECAEQVKFAMDAVIEMKGDV